MLTPRADLAPQELKRHNAQSVVRVCEPSYKTDLLEKEGIAVTDLVFDDGTFPPAQASLPDARVSRVAGCCAAQSWRYCQ